MLIPTSIINTLCKLHRVTMQTPASQLAHRLHQDGFPHVNMSYCYATAKFDPPTCWHVRDSPEFIMQVSFITGIVTVGLIGNLLLGMLICLSPRLRSKSINLFIFNLCLANFLNLLLVAPSQVTNSLTEFYLLGPFACKAVSMMQIIFFVVPMLTLVVISLDRLLAIKYPFRETTYSWKALLTCVVIWAIGIGISIDKGIVRHFSLVQYQDFNVTMCYDSNEKGNANGQEYDKEKLWLRERIYWMSVFTICFLLPFLGMLIFYVGILIRIKSIARKFSISDQIHNRNVVTVALMVIIVMLTTLVCWMPMIVFWFKKYAKPEVPKPSFMKPKVELDTLYITAQFCIFLHCSIQPIIYFATGSKLRSEARKIFPFIRNFRGNFPGVEALLHQHARMMDLSVEKTFHVTDAGDNSTDEAEVDSGPEDITRRNTLINNNNNNNNISKPSSKLFSEISVLALPALGRKLSTRSLGIADVSQMMTEKQKQESKSEDVKAGIDNDNQNRKISDKSTMSDNTEGRIKKTSFRQTDMGDKQLRKISDKSTKSDNSEGRAKKASLMQIDLDPGDTPSGSPATRRKSHVTFF